jgi:uncharacterized phage protein (TIGR01671 family)
MREIEFRGKNNETGKFVYGWYSRLQKEARRYNAIIADIDGRLTEFYIHDEKTIGQYTGLKDCEGKKVFEGDIVLDESSKSKYFVEWVSGLGRWRITCRSFDGRCSVSFDIYGFWGLTKMKIIGNIHDNAELLPKPADE